MSNDVQVLGEKKHTTSFFFVRVYVSLLLSVSFDYTSAQKKTEARKLEYVIPFELVSKMFHRNTLPNRSKTDYLTWVINWTKITALFQIIIFSVLCSHISMCMWLCVRVLTMVVLTEYKESIWWCVTTKRESSEVNNRHR